MVTMVWVAHRN